VQGIPQQALPPLLAAYQDEARYPRIGSLFEPDYEKVKALKPDLIIAGNRTLPKIAALKKFAPVLDVTVGNGDQLPQIYRNIRAIAAVYGVPERVEAEIQAIEARIAAVKAQAQQQGSALFLMTNGGKMSVYGPGSRFDMVYSVFGAQPTKEKIEVSQHG